MIIQYNNFITQNISNVVNSIATKLDGIWQRLVDLTSGVIDFLSFIPLMLHAGDVFVPFIIPSFYAVFVVAIVVFIIKIILGSGT